MGACDFTCPYHGILTLFIYKVRQQIQNSSYLYMYWVKNTTVEDQIIHILLAEDDNSMRGYLQRALEKSDYKVDTVSRGTDALPLLEGGQYDLLLTDIVMPEMDGIELAQKCAKLSPDTKVMFITGFAAVSLKAEKAAPQARVLSKPFHLKDLVMEVDKIFDRGSAIGF